MVAPNTQVSPLKHHLKGSNTLTSCRNYSRIQSEVQREGSEVHKENLLSLSLSKNGKYFGAGEKADAIAPSGSQVGHVHAQGASAKTGLPTVLSREMVTFSHGLHAQEHEHGTHRMDLRVSHSVNRFEPGTAKNPFSTAAFSSSASLQPLVQGEEAINAYNLYAEMFPRACTPVSTCTPTSDNHGEQEFCPSKPMGAEHVEVVQFLPDIKSVEDDQEDNVKRMKYTSTMENTSIGLFNMQTSKQGNVSCCVVDGSSISAGRDDARQAGTGEGGSFKCAYKSNNYTVTKPTQHNMIWVSSVNVYSACGTSLTAELSNAPPAVGLKLFTTSAHAQMPKALLTFSEGEPSLPLSLEHSQKQASNRLQRTPIQENSCTDADWGKFLALSATPVANNMGTASAKVLPFQQRFKELQAFLKQCDETDQNECMQALRSLSAATRSGHAVELETRAIRLSLEEGKEIKRMRLLNVLGKISEHSLDDAGATPHGPRLPAPGAPAKLKSVP